MNGYVESLKAEVDNLIKDEDSEEYSQKKDILVSKVLEDYNSGRLVGVSWNKISKQCARLERPEKNV